MKFKSAAAKKQHLENEKSWEAIMKKYPSTKPKSLVSFKPQPRVTRETTQYPSHPAEFNTCAKKPINQYTGTNMLGIGTLHKSNAIPIFSREEAIDLSKMRR